MAPAPGFMCGRAEAGRTIPRAFSLIAAYKNTGYLPSTATQRICPRPTSAARPTLRADVVCNQPAIPIHKSETPKVPFLARKQTDSVFTPVHSNIPSLFRRCPVQASRQTREPSQCSGLPQSAPARSRPHGVMGQRPRMVDQGPGEPGESASAATPTRRGPLCLSHAPISVEGCEDLSFFRTAP